MENDMPAKQTQPPVRTSNVGRVAVVTAVILFLLGLVAYISSSGEIQPAGEAPQSANESAAPPASTTPKASRVEGQVIVKFKEGITDQQINDRLSPLNASIKSKIEGINTTVISVPPGKEDAILKELADDPIVQYAEPDYIYYLQFTPNDPDFGKQWGLVNTAQTVGNRNGTVDADIDAELAWDVSKGTGVKVAVLDSGIDASHPELASKVKGSKIFSTTSIVDKNGHGTHVAGIIAANANNGQGISGVCPDCQLLIGKIANDDSAGSVPTSAIAPSVTWAADSGVQVINMSIAGPNFSQAVQDAVNYAWSKNIVIVAAAGNDGGSAKRYPGAYTNVVSVANTNSNDGKSSTSNFGAWVFIAAPGDTIYSTFPTTPSLRSTSGYGSLTGTSMASPAVAGVAALVWKTQYGTSNAAVVQRMYSTADKIPGTGTSWVHGRVNAAAAVGASTTAPTNPPAPTNPTNAPGPISVVPTFVCGGSTNSICPTTPPNVSQSPGNTIPSSAPIGGNPSPILNPNPSPGTAPCIAGEASVAHSEKKIEKHKKHHGAFSGFFEALFRLIIEILNILLRQLGGGEINLPNPNPKPEPCPPDVQPAPAPSDQPVPSAIIPSTAPSAAPILSQPVVSANPQPSAAACKQQGATCVNAGDCCGDVCSFKSAAETVGTCASCSVINDPVKRAQCEQGVRTSGNR